MSGKNSNSERAKAIVEKLWGSKGIGLNVDERELLEQIVGDYLTSGKFRTFDLDFLEGRKKRYQRLIDKNIIYDYRGIQKLSDLEQQEVINAVDVEGMEKGGKVKNWITASTDKVAYPMLRTPDGRIWKKHFTFTDKDTAELHRDSLKGESGNKMYDDAQVLSLFDGTNSHFYVYVTGNRQSMEDNDPVYVIRVIENGKPVTLNAFSEKERDENFEEIKKRKLKIISVKSVPFQEWKSKGNKMAQGGTTGMPVEAEVRQMNALIAEYMGHQPTESNSYHIPERGHHESIHSEIDDVDGVQEYFSISELKYHSSWDWLMPVVKKIILSGHQWSLHYIIPRKLWKSTIFKRTDWSKVPKDEKGFSGGVKLSREKGEIFEVTNESEIIAVWYVVAEFVKWHHSNKMAKGGNISAGSMTLLEDSPVNINFSKGTFSEDGLSKEQVKFLKHIEKLWLEDKLNQKTKITALEKYKHSGRGEEILDALQYWESLNKPLDKKSVFHPSYLSDYLVGGGEYHLQINVGGEFNSRNVRITPKLESILKETTLLYPLAPKSYYFKISQRGDLYIAYQQIIGDRMIVSNVITDFEKGGDTSSKSHNDINWLITG